SQEKGATFANVRDGIRMAYTDTIIPETEQMYATMSHQLGLTADGLTLVPDFSHIAVLQDDEESKTVSMERRAQILKMAKESGIVITEEEYRSFVGMNK
ncbi:MAG: phage portal protein, partial [Cryomorphaceae bacterium]|nr:phage portal protein [Cryomorphaceae bacterium]